MVTIPACMYVCAHHLQASTSNCMHHTSVPHYCSVGCEKPTLNALYPVLPRIAGSWYGLGMKLGAEHFTLNIIAQNHKGDLEKCCKEMLQNWLNGKPDCGNCSRTWDGLLPVVETVVGSEISCFIREKVLNWEEEGVVPMEQGITESKSNWLTLRPLGSFIIWL